MTAPAVTNKSDNGDNNINEPMNPPSSPVTHHDEEYKFEKEEEVIVDSPKIVVQDDSNRQGVKRILSSPNSLNLSPKEAKLDDDKSENLSARQRKRRLESLFGTDFIPGTVRDRLTFLKEQFGDQLAYLESLPNRVYRAITLEDFLNEQTGQQNESTLDEKEPAVEEKVLPEQSERVKEQEEEKEEKKVEIMAESESLAIEQDGASKSKPKVVAERTITTVKELAMYESVSMYLQQSVELESKAAVPSVEERVQDMEVEEEKEPLEESMEKQIKELALETEDMEVGDDEGPQVEESMEEQIEEQVMEVPTTMAKAVKELAMYESVSAFLKESVERKTEDMEVDEDAIEPETSIEDDDYILVDKEGLETNEDESKKEPVAIVNNEQNPTQSYGVIQDEEEIVAEDTSQEVESEEAADDIVDDNDGVANDGVVDDDEEIIPEPSSDNAKEEEEKEASVEEQPVVVVKTRSSYGVVDDEEMPDASNDDVPKQDERPLSPFSVMEEGKESTQEDQTEETKEKEEPVIRIRKIRFADESGEPLFEEHLIHREENYASRIVVMLLSPKDRKFEFLHAEYPLDPSTTVQVVLEQIPLLATNAAFQTKKFTALLQTETSRELDNSLALQDYSFKESEIVLGIPDDFSVANMTKMAVPLLLNKKLMKTVKQAIRKGRGLKTVKSGDEWNNRNDDTT